jgi:hypothetical protein
MLPMPMRLFGRRDPDFSAFTRRWGLTEIACGLNSTLGPFHGGLRRHTVWLLAAGK